MHFLQNLLSYMCPPLFIFGKGNVPPPGDSFVITHTGAFVVTSAGDNVVAKS